MLNGNLERGRNRPATNPVAKKSHSCSAPSSPPLDVSFFPRDTFPRATLRLSGRRKSVSHHAPSPGVTAAPLECPHPGFQDRISARRGRAHFPSSQLLAAPRRSRERPGAPFSPAKAMALSKRLGVGGQQPHTLASATPGKAPIAKGNHKRQCPDLQRSTWTLYQCNPGLGILGIHP